MSRDRPVGFSAAGSGHKPSDRAEESAARIAKIAPYVWVVRLLGVLTGLPLGLVLFLAAFPLLFWNEGRAVRAARDIAQGRAAVVSVGTGRVDPGNEGRLVHFTGPATGEESLRDPLFGVTAKALRLDREVEMYQWVEDKRTKREKQIGGGTRETTTYAYAKAWRKELIGSDAFAQPVGHENPPAMAVTRDSWQAGAVHVGAFALPSALIAALPASETVAHLGELPAASARGPLANATEWEGGYYVGEDPGDPHIGDLRVRFPLARPMDVSVVGRQIGDSVGPYRAEAGTEMLRIEPGLNPAEVMLRHAADENVLLVWMLRISGFLAMPIGLALILRVVVALTDVRPRLGSVRRAGVGLAALALSAPLILTTIGLARVRYQPLLGGAALVAALALVVLLRRLGGARRAAAAAGPPEIADRGTA